MKYEMPDLPMRQLEDPRLGRRAVVLGEDGDDFEGEVTTVRLHPNGTVTLNVEQDGRGYSGLRANQVTILK